MKKYCFSFIFFVILTACAGSNGSNQDSPNPPTALSYSTTAATYTINLPITANKPTVTGTVTSWAVSPELPVGLVLDSTSGIISGTPTEIQSATEYIITAINSTGSTTTNISITINHEPPAALSYSTTAATYTINLPITANEPTVTGTVTSWSISPVLPAGLAINSTTGIISGTPTEIQSATEYIITASNSSGSVTTNISITVNHKAPTALSYSTTAATYTIDLPITANEPTVTGTVTSWSISPELPAGLEINTNTGIISGTPTEILPETDYTITASNTGGYTTANIIIIVNDEPPAGLTYSTSSAIYTINLPITANGPTVTGTVTSWSISPVLPTGLIMSTSTGIISGTPTEAQSETEYTITASNSGGSTTATISIAVSYTAPSGLTYSTSSANYTINLPITANEPTVIGTVTSWSISPVLPTGLIMSTSTGIISGTPTEAQSETDYTITATNPAGSTTSNISITVSYTAPSGLFYSVDPAVYTQNITIADNNPTVTGAITSWSVNPELPAGLIMNTTTGVISGTPTEAQSETEYIITATNPAGSSTANITIAVTLYLYAGGYNGNVPGFWGNKIWNPLEYSTRGEVLSLAVAGENVYTGGWIYNSNSTATIPCYWVNGSLNKVTNGYNITGGRITAITFANNIFYTGGYVGTNLAIRQPIYCINSTTAGFLSSGYGDFGEVFTIVVTGSDIYAGGYSSSGNSVPHPGYWLNGTWVGLVPPESPTSGGYYGAVHSLVINEGNIYAGGYYRDSHNNDQPGYWLNGTWTALPNPYKDYYVYSDAKVMTLFVSGNDVYAGGYCDNYMSSPSQIPGCWVNSTWVPFPETGTFVNSLIIVGTDVYAGGHDGYWYNGIFNSLNGGVNTVAIDNH